MNANAVLRARDLRVGWQDKPVATVNEITIAPGTITVLAGPNGAGKSTTVKTLARQIRPLSGSVHLDGTDIWSLPARTFARQVAYVPQILDPPHAMLVREMVALGRNPHQLWWSWERSTTDDTAIDQALLATETGQLQNKEVGALSGGELQRVSIAMALAQETQFLLLDEPTAHLDYKHQLQLVSLLGSLREKKLGILLVLHDLNLTARLADTVMLLKSTGEVAASGPPQTVLTEKTLLEVYDIEVAILNESPAGITTYVPLTARRN